MSDFHESKARGHMSAEGYAALKAFNEQASDWYSQCRSCKRERMGTIAHLLTEPCQHCGVVSGRPSQ